MPRMVSVNSMAQRVVGLEDTKDVNDWENGFIKTLKNMLAANQVTKLSDAQLEALDRLHDKHFA
jgi:hypothetical protein